MTAFAQSSVTIDGLFDLAYARQNGDHATYKISTVNSTTGSATSNVTFKVSEDMGGGTKASIQYELDPRASNLSSSNGPITHQTFLALTGNAGTIKLGNINGAALDAYGAGSPLGTALGSGYGLTNNGVGMSTRYAKSVKYESPVINGLSFSFNHAPGADVATAYVSAAQRKASDIGLKYSNGPLNIAFSQLTQAASTNLVTATAVPAGVAQSKFSSAGINYNLGDITLYAGWNNGDAQGAAASVAGMYPLQLIVANTKTKGTRSGIKYVTGPYTLIASTASQDIVGATSGAAKRKITGLRGEYALSKRTAVFSAFESFNTGVAAASASTTAEGGTIRTTAVGVRHSF